MGQKKPSLSPGGATDSLAYSQYQSQLKQQQNPGGTQESLGFSQYQQKQTPGGTGTATDSLAFSQSIALSNMAATIRGAQQTKQTGQINFEDLKNDTKDHRLQSSQEQSPNSAQGKSQLIFSGIQDLNENIGNSHQNL